MAKFNISCWYLAGQKWGKLRKRGTVEVLNTKQRKRHQALTGMEKKEFF